MHTAQQLLLHNMIYPVAPLRPAADKKKEWRQCTSVNRKPRGRNMGSPIDDPRLRDHGKDKEETFRTLPNMTHPRLSSSPLAPLLSVYSAFVRAFWLRRTPALFWKSLLSHDSRGDSLLPPSVLRTEREANPTPTLPSPAPPPPPPP